MQVPEWLRDAVERECAEIPFADLRRAAGELSEAYRAGTTASAERMMQRGDRARARSTTPVSTKPMNSAARRAAYGVVRLPATFAATRRVFEQIRDLAPDLAVHSVLDLGAGPGTASFAATEVWPEMERITLVERDDALIEMGRRLASASNLAAMREALWIRSDLANLSSDVGQGETFDLVIVSYVLNELTAAAAVKLAMSAWRAATTLVIVEPGTPQGFRQILAARDALAEAHIVAPCPRPDAHPCAMADANDWCHFSQRLERSSLHRRLKAGELAYEDEKFSYVALTHAPVATAAARIVRHPAIHKGHIELTVCTPDGVREETVTKRDNRYRAARRAQWGDPWQRED